MTKTATLNGIAFSSDRETALDDSGVTLKLKDLAGWYSTTMRTNFTERTNGDGDHVPGPSFRASKTMTLKAVVTSPSWIAVEDAWEAIAAVAGDGGDLTLRYEDTDAGSTRIMRRVRVEGTIEPVPFAPRKAEVAIPLRAYDPRKYAENERRSEPARVSGMQPAGAGLRYPLFSPVAAGAVSYQWVGAANQSRSRQYVGGVVQRTNYATDPHVTRLSVPAGQAGWTSSRWFGGGGGAGAYSIVSGASDGPIGTLSSYARKTWTTASTSSGDTGFNHTSGSGALAVTGGVPLSVSAYLRASRAHGTASVQLKWYDTSGAALTANAVDVAGANAPLAPGVWTRLSVATTVPANAGFVAIITDVDGGETWQPGDTLDGTGLLIETTSAVADYFDGDTPGTPPALSYGGLVAFNAAVGINQGRAAAYPVFYITGGSMSAGFIITDTTTGDRVVFTGTVDSSETLVLDMRTKRILSGQNDRTNQLTVNDTMTVPGLSSRSYTFDSLGSSDSGLPSLMVGVTDSWW